MFFRPIFARFALLEVSKRLSAPRRFLFLIAAIFVSLLCFRIRGPRERIPRSAYYGGALPASPHVPANRLSVLKVEIRNSRKQNGILNANARAAMTTTRMR